MSSPSAASDRCNAAPLLRSKSAQFPDFVDCCSPCSDDETRMQSNASAEAVPISANTRTAKVTRTRFLTQTSLSLALNGPPQTLRLTYHGPQRPVKDRDSAPGLPASLSAPRGMS